MNSRNTHVPIIKTRTRTTFCINFVLVLVFIMGTCVCAFIIIIIIELGISSLNAPVRLGSGPLQGGRRPV